MNRDPNVLTLLDRFTRSAKHGDPAVCTPWVEVPSWCHRAEFVFECLAFNAGSVNVELQSSMDRATSDGIEGGELDDVEVLQRSVIEGIGRYVRVALEPANLSDPNMVISAYLILKTAN